MNCSNADSPIGPLMLPDHAEQARTLDLYTVVQNRAHPFDIRFSWVHWWESNRERYFREVAVVNHVHRPELASAVRVGRTAPEPPPVPPAESGTVSVSGDAVSALRDAVANPNVSIRASAIIALAQADPTSAMDAVLGPRAKDGRRNPEGALIHDPSDLVRCPAWVALGLIGDDEARAYLFGHHPTAEYDAVGRVTALGLLRGKVDASGAVNDPAVRQELITTMRHSKWPEVQRMVLWALRARGPAGAWAPPGLIPGAGRFFPASGTTAQQAGEGPTDQQINQFVLQRTDNVFLAGEAMLALGDTPGLDDGALLKSVSEVRDPGRSLPSVKGLNRMADRGVTWSTDTDRLAMESRCAALLALARSPQPTDDHFSDQLRRSLRDTAHRVGELQRDDLVRGPALLALARQTHGENPDIGMLDDTMDGQALRYVEFRNPQPGQPAYQYREMTDRDDEYRSFAAIAIGLYLRRMTPGTMAAARWPLTEDLRPTEIASQRHRLVRKLTTALTSSHEPIELRAACAVALGLSGDRSQADVLASAASTKEPTLDGYIALGLGLLGDPRAGQLADVLFRQVRRAPLDPARASDSDLLDTPVDQVLSLRAAVEGASLVGGDKALDAVQRALEADDPWVQLDAAESAARMGATAGPDAVRPDRLVAQLRGDKLSPQRRVIAAFALGALCRDPGSAGLRPLSWHNNYTMSFRGRITLCGCHNMEARVQDTAWPMRRFLGYSQPFLYHMLLLR